MVRLRCAVPPDLLEALRARAGAEGLSFPEAVRRTLAAGLGAPAEGETPLEEARRILAARAREGSVQAAVALERSLVAEAAAARKAAEQGPPPDGVDDLAARRRRS